MKPAIFLLVTTFLFGGSIDDHAKLLNKKVRDHYPYIPGGEVNLDSEIVSVNGFYMMSTEVSNLEYREFLAYLKRNGMDEALEIASVKTDGWKQKPFQDNYDQHPAYEDYPVVNITREAAEMYCQFLQKALNDNDMIKEGYVIKNMRLPSRAEWVVAAQGGRDNAPYPWGGWYVRNSKGCILANFDAIGTENVTKDHKTGELKVVMDRKVHPGGVLFTAPVKAFFPNDYGLYQMSGNVAEMVSSEPIAVGGSWKSTGYDIRVQSTMPFKDYSSEVGFRPIFDLVKK